MKIHLSKNAVNNLLFILDDCYRLDVAHPKEYQIWSDFDCLTIIRDLMTANRQRGEDDFIEINEDTANWISVATENISIDLDKPSQRHTLSRVTVQALVKSSEFNLGIA